MLALIGRIDFCRGARESQRFGWPVWWDGGCTECLHPGAAGEWRNRAGLLTAAVFAASYIQIQYSSEARGYAPAVFFGMVALYAMLRGATTASSRWIAAYWSGCILGMLSHAVFIPIQLGGIALSAHIAWRRTTSWPKRFAHLVDWNLVPSAALVGYDLAVPAVAGRWWR